MSDEADTSPDEQQPAGGSPATGSTEESDGSSSESFEGSDDPSVISDDQLPEDLRPTDDNPLAKPEGEDDDADEGMNLQEQAGDAGAAAPG
jgi:hypothetical protein